jgi:hypothetical protein
MKDEIEVLVNQNDVADIITRLSQIEDIQVAIQTNELSEPDPNAKHWTYNLSPQEVTAIIISIAGTTTSLISLATAIIELLIRPIKLANILYCEYGKNRY